MIRDPETELLRKEEAEAALAPEPPCPHMLALNAALEVALEARGKAVIYHWSTDVQKRTWKPERVQQKGRRPDPRKNADRHFRKLKGRAHG